MPSKMATYRTNAPDEDMCRFRACSAPNGICEEVLRAGRLGTFGYVGDVSKLEFEPLPSPACDERADDVPACPDDETAGRREILDTALGGAPSANDPAAAPEVKPLLLLLRIPEALALRPLLFLLTILSARVFSGSSTDASELVECCLRSWIKALALAAACDSAAAAAASDRCSSAAAAEARSACCVASAEAAEASLAASDAALDLAAAATAFSTDAAAARMAADGGRGEAMEGSAPACTT